MAREPWDRDSDFDDDGDDESFADAVSEQEEDSCAADDGASECAYATHVAAEKGRAGARSDQIRFAILFYRRAR